MATTGKKLFWQRSFFERARSRLPSAISDEITEVLRVEPNISRDQVQRIIESRMVLSSLSISRLKSVTIDSEAAMHGMTRSGGGRAGFLAKALFPFTGSPALWLAKTDPDYRFEPQGSFAATSARLICVTVSKDVTFVEQYAEHHMSSLRPSLSWHDPHIEAFNGAVPGIVDEIVSKQLESKREQRLRRS